MKYILATLVVWAFRAFIISLAAITGIMAAVIAWTMIEQPILFAYLGLAIGGAAVFVGFIVLFAYSCDYLEKCKKGER